MRSGLLHPAPKEWPRFPSHPAPSAACPTSPTAQQGAVPPLLQNLQQRKLSAAQISSGTRGEGGGSNSHSASRWVLLKTRRFVTPSHSSLILCTVLQGLDEKGAQLSCWRAPQTPSGCSSLHQYPLQSAPALPLSADAACLQARRLPPAAADSGCSLPPSAFSNNLGDTLAGICPQLLSARICLG